MSENLSEKEPKNLENQIAEVEEAKAEAATAAETVGAKTAEVVKSVVVEAIRSEFSGPIPPPSIIRGYEEILPGAADRIISMAEGQIAHRQAMERQMVMAESRDSLLGVLFAFFLGTGCIIAAVMIVFFVRENGAAIAGSILGITGVGSITSGFIRSVKGEQKQNTEKSTKKDSDDTEKNDAE